MNSSTDQRFITYDGVRGPHKFTRKRETSNQFHRIYSIKAGNRVVMTESQLEADAIFWAEAQSSVVHLCEQPMRIQGSIGSKPYYTFDLGVKHISGEEIFYEIKPESALVPNAIGTLETADWPVIKQWGEFNGYQCEILTDKALSNHNQLISNWRSLLGFVRIADKKNKDSNFSDSLLKHVEINENISTLELTNIVSVDKQHSVLPEVAKQLHRGFLSADLDSARFTIRTPLRLVT